MISFEGVSFTYAGKEDPALSHCSFQVRPGELILLCGVSGCGKTTVLKLVNGLLRDGDAGTLEGRVLVQGRDASQIPLWELSQTVGSVFQNPKSQFFNLDTTSEVLFGLENRGAAHEEMEQALSSATQACGIQKLLDRNIFQLSGGEKQRIACASAYAMGPSLFALDEPSSNLDADGIRMLREILTQLKHEGKTVLLAEHRLWYAADLADRIFYLKDGVLERRFTRAEFLALSDEERRTMGLRSLTEVPLPQPDPTLSDSSTTDGLSVQGLSASYGNKPVWEDVSFCVQKGEIAAITGTNGAGKTTLARCLCGLHKESAGKILWEGKPLSPKARKRASFLIMQDVNFQLFADSVLAEAMLGNDCSEEEAKAALQQMDLLPFLDCHPMALSGGQKQRLAVVSGTLSGRKLLLFDELTSGLDYLHMREVSRELQTLAAAGYCILVITHDGEFIRESGAKVIQWNNHMEGGAKPVKQSNLRRLLDYAGSRKVLLYLSWALSAISALAALVPFWSIWRILQAVLTAVPHYEQAQHLTQYGWTAVLFAVLSMLLYFAALFCSHFAAFRVASNLRKKLVRHIALLPLGTAEVLGSGKLRKIIQESAASTETYLAHQLPDLAGAVATPFGLLALLLSFDWRLGLLSLVPVLLGFVFMMAASGAHLTETMKEYQDALDGMANEAVEYVRGIPVVKTFGQTVYSFHKFKDAIDNYGKWVIEYTKGLRMPMVLYTAAINGIFAALIAGTFWFTDGTVSTAFLTNLLFYIIVTPAITLTLTKIMAMSENQVLVADALNRIDGILSLEPLPEPTTPIVPQDNSVELDHVSFQYEESNEVLHHISLRIESGQTVALVGPSGGGKSTLASLVSRFFDPQGGAVRIGGVDVRDIPKVTRMDTVSFVFQNSKLIKASILDNVRMAKPGATEGEIQRALETAQCGDILEKLPQGVHTVIGKDGVYLSGGEQQRIAIARAMLKDAPILILDEATAFADPDNEGRVQAALSNLAKGKTVLLIAHRLSTVSGADKICVIADGRIAEEGTRKELLQKNGLFSRMWREYQTSAQWKVGKGASA